MIGADVRCREESKPRSTASADDARSPATALVYTCPSGSDVLCTATRYALASTEGSSLEHATNLRSFLWPRRLIGKVLLNLLLMCLMLDANAIVPQPPTDDLITYLEQRFGLSEIQVRGALGALLVYAQQRLEKTEFDALAANVPNAERIMQDVKLRGIVTRPLNDINDYENSLVRLGIGQPLASQIMPAVLEYLGATGHDLERDILAGIAK